MSALLHKKSIAFSMKTTYIFLLLLATQVCQKVAAQTTELYIADGETFYIAANETVGINGLTITPSSGFILTKSVYKQSSLTNSTGVAAGSYIPVVYRFDGNTNAFSGVISVSYAGEETATEAMYKIQYHNGTGWTRVAGSTVNTTTDIVTSSNLSGVILNELTISDLTTLLPVTWLSFNGHTVGHEVLLQWTTATEYNTKTFEVQHSTNAIHWTTVGTVAAAGNSNTQRSYSFNHLPTAHYGQVNHYRIVQHDRDGKFSYSTIIHVLHTPNSARLLMYPNPAHSVLHLYLPEPQTWSLKTAVGIEIWRQKLPAGNHSIPVQHLPKGMYWLVSGEQQYRLLLQ